MKNLVLVWTLALIVSAVTHAQREYFNDGSFTDYEESGSTKHWNHAVPIGGDQFRAQWDIREEYFNAGGFVFRGVFQRLDDNNLDGDVDYLQYDLSGSNGSILFQKIMAYDSNGYKFVMYSDINPRLHSSAWFQGRNDKYDARPIRVYGSGICYVEGGGCTAETRCDAQIQNFNQLHYYELLKIARQGGDPIAIKAAELRYEREREVLRACRGQ